MNVGDIVTCIAGYKWIVFDFSDDKKFLYLAGFHDHKSSGYLAVEDIVEYSSQPKNVEWLFLKRRMKNLKGLEKFI